MVLEGELSKDEEVTPTQTEEADDTQPKGEQTVRTYSAEEFRMELDKALGKGLVSTNKQLSLRKQETAAAKAEAEEHKANIASLTAELEDIRREQQELISRQFEDDPEARKAYVDRHAIAEEKRKLAKDRAEVEQKLLKADKLAYSALMAKKADALSKETGVPLKDLEDCETEGEMEIKALRYQLHHPAGKKAEEEEELPKFDGLRGGGKGSNFDNLSPREKIEYGLSHPKK